jgi:hypothetical protein
MPRYKLTWCEKRYWSSTIEARDKLEAQQKFDNWDDEVSEFADEIDRIGSSDLEIEEVNADINSIN